ncbi:MAG: FeoA domain-containing protein, partial [Porphyromonas sp.]|nr:FeoA domain-containing protein [Porphyromonas sp.]
MTLSELKIGEKAVIVHVNGTGQFRKRILEMGFINGKEVTVIQGAPMDDPVHYRILGYDVSLRRADAEQIEVRPLAPEDTIIAPEDTELYPPQLSQEALQRIDNRDQAKHPQKHLRIALVGNPNCGKTSLFNQASGAHEHVGNYSGVTVERKTGY